ncbi:hypothetical protein PPYR_08646 [Photinus pyralis]|uniref:Uncharacterized protein n=1 Tax=Photinus pyralis TaxID=7054 RepID=A0A1Y1LVG9_PHOPY|nr:uncharacterized protein LOC116172639 [Photinus pyralis]KAB0797653.1 hypothetical protein PPYR_08646 [Photinus pyralis]
MKIKVAIFLGFALLVLSNAAPADDYDYADGAAAPPPKPAARNPLLNRRNHLNRQAAPKTSTTTTAAPEVAEEEEIPEDELVEEEVQPETSSTTESGRRLKGGILRPFRSNHDLLETLKKRREQAIINKANSKTAASDVNDSESVGSEPEKPASKPARTSSSSRGRYSKKETNAVVNEEESPSTAAPRNSGRRFRN